MLDVSFIVRQCVAACECAEAVVDPALQSFGVWLADVGSDPHIHPVEQLAGCVDSALARAESTFQGLMSVRGIIPRATYLTSQVRRLLVSN